MAAEENDLLVFSDDLNVLQELSVIPENFSGSMRFKMIDFGADAKKELAVSYGNQERPEIRIYNNNGDLQNSWFPYAQGFTGEISLTAADLDNDGHEELITAPGAGGGPQIRIFNDEGNPLFSKGFWAADKDYRAGLEIATGDVDGDGFKEIIISVIDGENAQIKFFDRFGNQKGDSITITLENNFEPVKVAAIDLGADGTEEIIVGFGSGNEPKIKILRRDGSAIKEFLAYAKNFEGGVNFSVVKNNGQTIIVTGAGFSGGPHVRFFDSFGTLIKNPAFFSYDKNFRGGVNVDYGDFDGDGKMELITLPQQINPSGNSYLYKYIDIDVSEQKLRYYQNGRQVNEFQISSGKKSMPTPYGEFKIWQKNPRAYSKTYALFMPWWMSFKPSYGIHELPEWPSGYKEGQNHLGNPVSHGCVRLGVGPAKTLYDWTPIGTPVIIHE